MFAELQAKLEPIAQRVRGLFAGREREVLAFRIMVLVHLVALWMYFHVLRPELMSWMGTRIEDDYFPALLQARWLAVVLYLVPVVLLVACLLVDSLKLWRFSATVFVVSMYGLLLHQRTFAEAFAAGNFWGALYLCWYSWSVLGQPAPDVQKRRSAAALAQLFICFLYFAGTMGKLTELYETGDGFAYWGYPGSSLAILHKWFSTQQLAHVYVTMAVIGEATIAASVLLAPRVTFLLMFMVAVGMVNGGTPRFFDAIGPLFGMACAGWLLTAREPEQASAMARELAAPAAGSA